MQKQLAPTLTGAGVNGCIATQNDTVVAAIIKQRVHKAY